MTGLNKKIDFTVLIVLCLYDWNQTASIQSSASKEDESSTTEETLHQAQQQVQQQAQQQETKEEIIPTKIGPNLSRLWSYECSATKAFTVTCLAWNKQNPVCPIISLF